MGIFSFLRKKSKIKVKLTFIKDTDINGIYGVFADYPKAEEVMNQLKLWSDEIFPAGKDKKYYPARRSKDLITLDINEEAKLVFVKGKLENHNFGTKEMFKKAYPRNPFIDDDQNFRKQFSVMNELISNRIASHRYLKKFHRTLNIEIPIGFFISQRDEDKGSRWVLFEYIPNEVSLERSKYGLNKDESMFKYFLTEKLNSIGIFTDSLKHCFDVIPTESTTDPEFFLVDSEEWRIEKRM